MKTLGYIRQTPKDKHRVIPPEGASEEVVLWTQRRTAVIRAEAKGKQELL